jgi:hypothetical protein
MTIKANAYVSRLIAVLFACALLMSGAVPTRSYTVRFNNSASVQLRWATDSSGVAVIPIALSTSLTSPPANIKAGSDAIGAARRALARWEAVSNIRFSIVSSSAQAISPVNQQGVRADGINLITVADTQDNRGYVGSVALGRANTVFDPATGIIVEGDIVINPAYVFSTDGSTNYDLETTLTHELGHLLGLGHSASVGATMNANQGESPMYNGPATAGRSLSEDDIAGIRSIYGAPQASGTIAGTILNSAGAPLFGAHIWAEDVVTGRVAAGNVTRSDGSYRISGVLPGTYRLAVGDLDGFVAGADISSGNAAYSGLGNTVFRTYEFPSQIAVAANQTTPTNITVPNSGGVVINPRRLAVRDGGTVFPLSTFAVPLVANTTRTVYVFGDNLISVPASGISFNSPYLSIVPGSYGAGNQPGAGEGVRFDVNVRADAPGGDYSIRLQSASGEIAYVTGGLTIEPNGNNPTPITDAFQTEIKSWTVGGRTSAFVKLTFPDDSYRVASWGTATRSGTTFTAEARIERVAGVVPVPYSNATIYDLGALAAGNYAFSFKTNSSSLQSLIIAVSTALPAPNPIDAAREFARQHYSDFLSREPDAPGLDFWTNEIASCGADARCIDIKRVSVSGSFFLSSEFQSTGYYVYRVYQGALGRRPRYVEFLPEVRAVAAGIVVNNALSPSKIDANKLDFARAFVVRDEFRNKYPETLTASEYVDRLFQTTGIAPEGSERNALIVEMSGGGTLTERRASVLYKVVDGTRSEQNGVDVRLVFLTRYGKVFYDREYNPAFVQMQYFGYLRRDPDQAGFDFWLGKLNSFRNFIDAEMVRSFILASEYRARFGQP